MPSSTVAVAQQDAHQRGEVVARSSRRAMYASPAPTEPPNATRRRSAGRARARGRQRAALACAGRRCARRSPSTSVMRAVLSWRAGRSSRSAQAREQPASAGAWRGIARTATDRPRGDSSIERAAHGRVLGRASGSAGACRAGWSCTGTRFSHSRSACQWIAAMTCSGHQREAQQRAASAARDRRALAARAWRRRPVRALCVARCQRHVHRERSPGARKRQRSRASIGMNGETCNALACAQRPAARRALRRAAARSSAARPTACW